jgi:hypothetical protein
MLFETASGEVHMNIAMDYSRQRSVEAAGVIA